ncbi:hypothetical protein [Actinocorallia aurea]
MALALWAVFAATTWLGLLHRTVCDVENKTNGSPCGDDAYGVLRACWRREHRRLKRRIIAGWLGVRGQRPPEGGLWSRSEPPSRRRPPARIDSVADDEGSVTGGRGRIVLFATVISAGAAVIALAVEAVV